MPKLLRFSETSSYGAAIEVYMAELFMYQLHKSEC